MVMTRETSQPQQPETVTKTWRMNFTREVKWGTISPKMSVGQTWGRRSVCRNEGSRWEDVRVSLPLLVNSCRLIDSLEWQIVQADKSSDDTATQNRACILTPNLWGKPVTRERGWGCRKGGGGEQVEKRLTQKKLMVCLTLSFWSREWWIPS